MSVSQRGYDGYSFVRASVMAGGAFRTVARFTCGGCGATHDEKIPTGAGFNPQAYVNRAKAKGWDAGLIDRRGVRCPECAKSAKPKNGKIIPMAAQPPAIRRATPEQRVAIRGFLDKHFDDSVGRYLDGQSDQKIADAVNVPRFIVEQIREIGYGPIQADPAIDEIRAEADAIRGEIGKLTARVDALFARLDKIAA